MDTLTEQEKEDWVDATPSKGVFRYNNITKQVLRCLTIPAPHQGTVRGFVVIKDLRVADLVVFDTLYLTKVGVSFQVQF